MSRPKREDRKESVMDQICNIKINLHQLQEHLKTATMAADAARLHVNALEHDLQKEMRDDE